MGLSLKIIISKGVPTYGQSVHFCAKHAEMMIASNFERKSQNDLQSDRGLSLRLPTTSGDINSPKYLSPSQDDHFKSEV